MRFYATASGPKVRDAMTKGLLGQICTPAAGNVTIPGVDWAADNGVFGGKYPGDDAYLGWLGERSWAAADCAFAVAPDVVCDAQATLERSAPLLPAIRRVGYPVALAAQNGLERLSVPWRSFDVLFLGGDTEWKIDDHSLSVGVAAKRRRGERANWSTKAKMRAHLIAESCIKQLDPQCRDGHSSPDNLADRAVPACACSPYRVDYDRRRVHTATTHPEWTDGHSHNDALRVASKEILKDLWRAARDWHGAQ